jgi:hypothetical protein
MRKRREEKYAEDLELNDKKVKVKKWNKNNKKLFKYR